MISLYIPNKKSQKYLTFINSQRFVFCSIKMKKIDPDDEEFIHHEVPSDDELQIEQVPPLGQLYKSKQQLNITPPIVQQSKLIQEAKSEIMLSQQTGVMTYKNMFQRAVVQLLQRITDCNSEEEEKKKQKIQIIAIHGIQQYQNFEKQKKLQAKKRKDQQMKLTLNSFQKFQSAQVKLSHEQSRAQQQGTDYQEWRAKKYSIQLEQQKQQHLLRQYQQQQVVQQHQFLIQQHRYYQEQQYPQQQTSLDYSNYDDRNSLYLYPFLPPCQQVQVYQQLPSSSSIYPHLDQQTNPNLTKQVDSRESVSLNQTKPLSNLLTSIESDKKKQKITRPTTWKTIILLKDYIKKLETDMSGTTQQNKLIQLLNSTLNQLITRDPYTQISKDVSLLLEELENAFPVQLSQIPTTTNEQIQTEQNTEFNVEVELQNNDTEIEFDF